MEIIIGENTKYDTGTHPDVIEVDFDRSNVNDFFEGDRFPNLKVLNISNIQCTELKLNSSSLQRLVCCFTNLTILKLDCPSLVDLDCYAGRLIELELNCPLLHRLECSHNNLSKLELNCPLLQGISCQDNQLTEFQLNCPLLEILWCNNNPLTNLHGLEFCDSLTYLKCSRGLETSVQILKKNIPGLVVVYC
jgi:hypothetical protein